VSQSIDSESVPCATPSFPLTFVILMPPPPQPKIRGHQTRAHATLKTCTAGQGFQQLPFDSEHRLVSRERIKKGPSLAMQPPRAFPTSLKQNAMVSRRQSCSLRQRDLPSRMTLRPTCSTIGAICSNRRTWHHQWIRRTTQWCVQGPLDVLPMLTPRSGAPFASIFQTYWFPVLGAG
jgi:hypothetical protein